MDEQWYRIENTEDIDTPALAVYPDRVLRNIRLLKEIVPDTERLRPHVKTTKSSAVIRMMMNEGITKFKCATIAEAELLASAGAPDVLVAYQPIGPKAKRLSALIQKYPATTFSCLVDNPGAAAELNDTMREIHHCLPVFIDLNVGMNRTGVDPGESAATLFRQLRKLDGLLPVGLHVYDGHIRDSDRNIRKQNCDDAFRPVTRLKAELQKSDEEPLIIVAGGSPTFSIHAERPEVECSPGTFVFWDYGYRHALPELPFRYAALLLTRIISLPATDLVCTDLGHKSVASENPLNKRIFFLNATDLEPVSQSEEHLVLRAPQGHVYKVGDILYGVPYHICPTCALYDTMEVVKNRQIIASWHVEARTRALTL